MIIIFQTDWYRQKSHMDIEIGLWNIFATRMINGLNMFYKKSSLYE